MIAVTGAAGFIGSNMVARLNEEGYTKIIVVDEFSREDKNRNLEGKNYISRIHRDEFVNWLQSSGREVEAVFHLGARTDTTETDKSIFDSLNLNYSKEVWDLCATYNIPLVYASSAATYGGGEHGYKDDHNLVFDLKPMNPYGESKNEFDKWVMQQSDTPPFWTGVKFFNVYGPNEYHKGRMASVIFHAFHQIKQTGKMKLFRSHRSEYHDGEQLRDFIYIKDVVDVLLFMMQQEIHSGIYNLGTGQARTFNDLVKNVFHSIGKKENIVYIDTPEDIRDKYQYFTEAEMQKLRSAGYDQPFYSLEEGIYDYVRNYLIPGKYR
ncbi:MAG: ADP-glyceromanno-heptose 6-epimerase [Bacteroidota bacterium]